MGYDSGFISGVNEPDTHYSCRIREEAERERAEAAERKLARLVEAVIGWREHDWPAWFCRRTAEAIADRVREIQATGEGK